MVFMNTTNKKPVALVILDGLGYSPNKEHNPVYTAKMPTYTMFVTDYPHALINTSGESVGLPKGIAGNSLVGHLAMGAGRVINQPITALNNAIDNGSFFNNKLLLTNFAVLKASGKTLHLMGLVSDGASHSHEKQLHALIRLAAHNGIRNIVVHAFLDGRDVTPRSAAVYLQKLDALFKEVGCGTLGSIHGRAYPMDRNERVEYITKSFDVLTQPQTPVFDSWQQAVAHYYEQGINDELIPPTALSHNCQICDGDGLIFFNIRADRARSLTRMFLQPAHPQLAFFITGIQYEPDFAVTGVLFEQPITEHTLLDVLEAHRYTLFTIAEKEKHAHVTYFFNGGREVKRQQETRVIVPSLPLEKVITHPQMSAPEITNAVLQSLTTKPANFYLINYANADLVGHTGDFDATVKALICLDEQLHKLYTQIVEKMGGTLFIVSDHGNAEDKYDPITKQPRTAHTTNPVYFALVTKDLRGSTQLPYTVTTLADVAPCILTYLGLPIPDEMRPHASHGKITQSCIS